MKIGFIGLGRMGLPMAEQLIAADHTVRGFDLDEEPLAQLVAAGGERADDVADAAAGADVVITVLRTPDQVSAVADELLPAMEEGAVYVDMSSIDPLTAEDIATRAEPQNIPVVDAPVSGGVAGAEEGTLSIMVGGDDDIVDIVWPLFEVMGEDVFHVGDIGAGQAVKLANQMLVGAQCVLLSEVFHFAEAVDIDTEILYDVLTQSLGRTGILELKGERLLTHDFEPGFDIELQAKDLRLGMEAAEEYDVPMHTVGSVFQTFVQARREGLGDRDHLGVYELLAK